MSTSSSSAPSKTLMDFFQPPSKRIKTTPTSLSIPNATDANANASSASLSVDQKLLVDYNKHLAKSKRNLKTCLDMVSNSEGVVKLEELLVEDTWLEALSGELQKPYALSFSKFVESEICSSSNDAVYPPSHLIFNVLKSTPFDRVKAVILGQVCSSV
ncbi:hypothetical protein PIB30_051065 [Stylosanthes scabra]|uniref:Uncharacterized protein n=1 Tax=Stylosanthes scabra TaxID=79078 RepID=A0ABU6VKU3_9FABA|nr:hypothetical protein [Stylosanthes scabra]